jgi:hypothetical protein
MPSELAAVALPHDGTLTLAFAVLVLTAAVATLARRRDLHLRQDATGAVLYSAWAFAPGAAYFAEAGIRAAVAAAGLHVATGAPAFVTLAATLLWILVGALLLVGSFAVWPVSREETELQILRGLHAAAWAASSLTALGAALA